MSKRDKTIEFEEGSGNVFADLGLEDAGEVNARAQMGFCVYKILKAEAPVATRGEGAAGMLHMPARRRRPTARRRVTRSHRERGSGGYLVAKQ